LEHFVNLLRLVVIGLVVWLVVGMVRRYLQKSATSSNDQRAMPKKMVRCAHCGLHIPEVEAVQSDTKYYCSLEHSKANKH